MSTFHDFLGPKNGIFNLVRRSVVIVCGPKIKEEFVNQPYITKILQIEAFLEFLETIFSKIKNFNSS